MEHFCKSHEACARYAEHIVEEESTLPEIQKAHVKTIRVRIRKKRLPSKAIGYPSTTEST